MGGAGAQVLKKSEAAGLVEAYSQWLGRAGPLQGASAAAPARAPSAQARRAAPPCPPPPPPPLLPYPKLSHS